MKPLPNANVDEQITALIKPPMANLLYPVDMSSLAPPDKDPKFRDLIAVLQQQMGDPPTGVLTTDQFFRLSQASDNIDRHLILDSQDEIGALVGYLTTNEANSEKLVYLSLSGDHFGRPEMLNVINVDLSGFSKGIAALDTACAAPR